MVNVVVVMVMVRTPTARRDFHVTTTVGINIREKYITLRNTFDSVEQFQKSEISSYCKE